MDLQTIARLRKYFTIKKSTPGRLKIKFDRAVIADPEAAKLANRPPQMPKAFKGTDLNIFTATLTIDYDEEQLTPSLLEELITAESDERALEVVQELHSELYH
ncbi:hypothetical protein [Salidesulfovibrio onnuriiensis]|uniref:hypothetical protein n=1 Tax=Salidesulfovibrio onnuriiensis TaxID=2583823 RepID=UPI0011C8AEBF|nr:hypothetical protein [Salidesulfovibrio onnuriiensis]